MTRKHALQLAGLVASCLIFGALMYWISIQDTRSPSALALADQCVDEEHRAAHLDPNLSVRCQQYFRLRSDREAAADEQWWQDHHKQRSGETGRSP